MPISYSSIWSSVVSAMSCSLRYALLTNATGVVPSRWWRMIACASTICRVRRPLAGLYSAITKSAAAACSMRCARRADERRAGVERGHAGNDAQLGCVAALPADLAQHLEHEARHAVHTGIARR